MKCRPLGEVSLLYTAIILLLSLLFNFIQPTFDPPWYMATSLPARGEVTFYAPDVMERAYHRRLELAQTPYCDKPACVGYVATLRPGDLGRKVWLVRPGSAPEGPFLVVDFAAAGDFERLRERGVIAEVDYETARRWGITGPVYDVTMLAESPLTERVLLPMIVVGRQVQSQDSPAAPRQ